MARARGGGGGARVAHVPKGTRIQLFSRTLTVFPLEHTRVSCFMSRAFAITPCSVFRFSRLR